MNCLDNMINFSQTQLQKSALEIFWPLKSNGVHESAQQLLAYDIGRRAIAVLIEPYHVRASTKEEASAKYNDFLRVVEELADLLAGYVII